MEDSSTLTLEGFTPYSQVPRWIVRSQGALSGNAVHLYSVLMSYADNGSKAAFPSRATLAGDMGRSVNTVKRAMAELEAFGAMRVARRRSEKTGANISNLYVLVFSDPRATREPGLGAPVSHELHPTEPRPTSTPSRSPSSADEDDSSLRSPSPTGRGVNRELLALAREAAQAAMADDRDDAADALAELFEDMHGVPAPDWDHGWSARLDQLVRDHGIEYGSAKWLRIFTSTALAA